VTRLLVVDDSPLMRRLMSEAFACEADFELEFARSGLEALEKLHAFRPDVVTLDVEMPEMNGLECLDRIMVERPTPVVVVSAVTVQGAEEALAAMELGAVDVVAKPGGALSLRMEVFAPQIVEKVRAASRAKLPATHRLRERVRAKMGAAPQPQHASRLRPSPRLAAIPAQGEGLVLVGCSTGGPPALDVLLRPLPASFPWPIVVAQHMPASFTGALAKRLNGLTALDVVELSRPEKLAAGCVYVARGDADVIVSRRGGGLAGLSAPADAARRWHPSVDRLVESALEHLPAARILGVLMTGMGDDGAAAMGRLFDAGGRTLAESEESAVVWGMPGALVRAGCASEVCDLDQLPRALIAALAA